jgi:hypothetical protein
MEDLSRILHDLNQGNTNVKEAKEKVLFLFNVIKCDHNYDHYANYFSETVAVCDKCLNAYF